MSDVTGRLAEAAYDVGHREGWLAGWNAGYNYAFDRFKEAMQLQNAATPPPRPTASNSESAGLEQADGGKAVSTAAIVLHAIRNNPGMRGVEIVAQLQRGDAEIKERTVRTALHRLRGEKIYIEDGRWYPIDEAIEGEIIEKNQ